MLHSSEGRSLWMKGQRAENFETWWLKHRCFVGPSKHQYIACTIISHLDIGDGDCFGPLSETSSSCHGLSWGCDSATHGLGFSAGNIYLLGAKIFLWICPLILGLNWRLLRLVLFNMTVWSVPYWFIAGTTVGAISDFWACSERVRNKQSYSGAGINKKEGRQYGTGEDKVCIQKLSSIKVKVCHSLKELYNIRFRLKKIFLCLPQVKTKQEHPRIQIFFSLYNMKWSRNRKSINSVVFWFLCCMERISSTISQKKWKDRLRFAELLKKARLLNSLSRLYISFQKVYKLFLL